jgi:hypothetical protein
VDSGSNTAVIYPLEKEELVFARGFASGRIHTLNKDQICRLARAPLMIGRRTYQRAIVAICLNTTRKRIDNDGLLPTTLFHRVFIGHHEKYLIAEPRPSPKRKVPNIKLAETITHAESRP